MEACSPRIWYFHSNPSLAFVHYPWEVFLRISVGDVTPGSPNLDNISNQNSIHARFQT